MRILHATRLGPTDDAVVLEREKIYRIELTYTCNPRVSFFCQPFDFFVFPLSGSYGIFLEMKPLTTKKRINRTLQLTYFFFIYKIKIPTSNRTAHYIRKYIYILLLLLYLYIVVHTLRTWPIIRHTRSYS